MDVLQPTLGPLLPVLDLCLAFPPMPFPPSKEYIPPAPNTIIAPSSVPVDNLFPNNQILKSRLTSFRTFRTIVTVRADAVAASKLTPLIQAYCVKTLMTKYASWLGICIRLIPSCRPVGRSDSGIDRVHGNISGADAASSRNCLSIEGKKGKKSGSERK